jgi:hypothetical protein
MNFSRCAGGMALTCATKSSKSNIQQKGADPVRVEPGTAKPLPGKRTKPRPIGARLQAVAGAGQCRGFGSAGSAQMIVGEYRTETGGFK